MKERLMRFMAGRYGMDTLNKAMGYAAIILIVLSRVIPQTTVRWVADNLGLLLIIFMYIRMLSRNYPKRAEENRRFLQWTAGIRNRFGNRQQNTQPGVHIYKCPHCKQKIRVPSGKGKIEITCPKCGTAFIRRS